jgi:hypothetical protein
MKKEKGSTQLAVEWVSNEEIHLELIDSWKARFA